MRRPRTGFTLVELLVVIAVIGILVALLLPAVQAAREAARRTQCANNMKQIGLALHNYHGTYRAFPMTTSNAESGGSGCRSGFYSWMAMLLPFMEQNALHDSIDFNVGMMDSCGGFHFYNMTISSTHPNAEASQVVVPSYVCPSDMNVMTSTLGDALPAPGSYAANLGWPKYTTGIAGLSTFLEMQNGALGVIDPAGNDPWQQGRVQLADFTDGTSYTVAIAERRMATGASMQDLWQAPESLRSYCGGGGSSRSLPQWIRYCGSVSAPDPAYSLPLGRSWISGWTMVGNTYMHVFPINDRHCHIYGGEDEGNNIVTPSSQHPGGINVVLADGSVRFVGETVDMTVWWSVGSRNGGEAVEQL